jgi:hypothetical protein
MQEIVCDVYKSFCNNTKSLRESTLPVYNLTLSEAIILSRAALAQHGLSIVIICNYALCRHK